LVSPSPGNPESRVRGRGVAEPGPFGLADPSLLISPVVGTALRNFKKTLRVVVVGAEISRHQRLGEAVTVGIASARNILTLFILALVPLLLAITINFPAKAGAPEIGDSPPVEEVLPTVEIPGDEFDVILDTGTVTVGYESKISAIAITATPDD
jgi:hypothetical protein